MKMSQEHKIKFLLCLVTVNCNLRCRMCFNWKNNETEEIESSLLKAAISDLHKKGLFTTDASVVFAGGEALLRSDIFELIRFSRDLGLCTTLTTSGYPYNDRIREQLRDSDLTYIALPLDSLQRSVHDNLRGKDGVFDNAMQIIQDFPRKVTLTCTISAYNINEICEIAEWAEANDNITGLGFQALVYPFNSQISRDNFHQSPEFSHLWPKDISTVCANLNRLIKIKNKSKKIYTTSKHLNFFKEYFRNPANINRKVRCRTGDTSLTINNKGDVIFCNYIGQLGNIRELAITDILSAENVQEMKKRMLECRKSCEFYVNCFFED